MNKLYPTEHLKSGYFLKKSLILFVVLFFSFNTFSQNATNGGTISMDQEICPGEVPQLIEGTVPASGGGNTPIEYLWMTTHQANQSISDWSPATGSNNQANYVPPTSGVTTYYARCARRLGFNEFVAESNIVTITILNSPTAIINGNPDLAFIGTTVIILQILLLMEAILGILMEMALPIVLTKTVLLLIQPQVILP